MSRMCEFCGKSYQKANLVPRGIGNRVTKRTATQKKANLRSKRLDMGGVKVRVTICASCLKRLKKDIADSKAQVDAKTKVAAASI
jgi:ribosomal protein L28